MMTIIKYELKKIIQNKFFFGGIVTAFVVLFGMFYIYFFHSQLTGIAQVDEVYGKEAVIKNEQIANAHAGTLTDERIQSVISDYMKEIQAKRHEDFFDVFSWYTADAFLEDKMGFYEKIAESTESGKSLTVQDIKIKSVDEMGYIVPAENLKMGNFAPWKQLFDLISNAFIIVALFVILICSTLFSSDASRNMMPLLSSTKFGRGKLPIAKLLAGSIVTIATFSILEAVILTVFGFYFGFSGWDVHIQTNFYWNLFSFPVPLNNIQVLFIAFLVQFVGLMATMGITCLISSMTKSPFTSLTISVGLFFAPELLTNIFRNGAVSKFLLYFPINHSSVEKMFIILSSQDYFIFNTFTGNLIFILSLMLVFYLGMNTIVYSKMRYLNVM